MGLVDFVGRNPLRVSTFLVYVGFYIFIAFISLGIACALYYLAELIEEFLKTTKKVIDYAIKVTVAANLLLLFDRQPWYCIALGVVAHVQYYRLLHRSRFPYIQVASPDAVLAFCGFACNTGAWIWNFWGSYQTMEYIAAFLLVTTWIVPFVITLSISDSQTSLPGAGGYPYSVSSHGSNYRGDDRMFGSGGASRANDSRKPRGLALRIFDLIRRKRDEVIPDVLGNLPLEPSMMPKEKI